MDCKSEQIWLIVKIIQIRLRIPKGKISIGPLLSVACILQKKGYGWKEDLKWDLYYYYCCCYKDREKVRSSIHLFTPMTSIARPAQAEARRQETRPGLALACQWTVGSFSFGPSLIQASPQPDFTLGAIPVR